MANKPGNDWKCMLKDANNHCANEVKALEEFKSKLLSQFDVKRVILFGSKARGDASPDSDIDLLLVTGHELSRREKHAISDLLFDINISYDTLFSFIAIDASNWDSKLYSYLPLHKNVERDGIVV